MHHAPFGCNSKFILGSILYLLESQGLTLRSLGAMPWPLLLTAKSNVMVKTRGLSVSAYPEHCGLTLHSLWSLAVYNPTCSVTLNPCYCHVKTASVVVYCIFSNSFQRLEKITSGLSRHFCVLILLGNCSLSSYYVHWEDKELNYSPLPLHLYFEK